MAHSKDEDHPRHNGSISGHAMGLLSGPEMQAMGDASKPAASRVVEIPTGYTPGPWRAIAYGGSDFSDEVFTADGCQAIACAMSGFPPRKDVETDANARLIALAPDLAAAYQAQQAEIERLREALQPVLVALSGPDHLIREMQALDDARFPDSPLQVLRRIFSESQSHE